MQYSQWVDELLKKMPTDLAKVNGDVTKLDGALYHQVTSSMYGEHLEQWAQHFDPSQFLVIPSYYYYNDPESALHEIAAHVGSKVDAHIGKAKHANNYPTKQRIIGHVSEEKKTALSNLITPHMLKLRRVMCRLKSKGLKVGSWDDANVRKQNWFFMSSEGLKDCD